MDGEWIRITNKLRHNNGTIGKWMESGLESRINLDIIMALLDGEWTRITNKLRYNNGTIGECVESGLESRISDSWVVIYR